MGPGTKRGSRNQDFSIYKISRTYNLLVQAVIAKIGCTNYRMEPSAIFGMGVLNDLL